jgi:hypothetical protein
VFPPLAGALRLASVVICLIVIASFALFVVNQTGSASTHQQEEASGKTPVTKVGDQTHKSSLRRTVDDVSESITSPFSAVTAGSSSQWVIRAVNLLLALLVYGFGLAFLARVIRVRV